MAKLIARLIEGTVEPGEGLDLSLIAQLLGDKQTGLAIQQRSARVASAVSFACAATKPRLRVLALAAATDMGGNTPIEFLLERSDIELMTLYVIADAELPVPLPDHDVAIVIASDSTDCRDALRKIDELLRAGRGRCSIRRICVGNLDRDKLHRLLDGIDGLEIPVTIGVSRAQLVELSRGDHSHRSTSRPILRFPLIVRPRGSHAGARPCEDRRSCRDRRTISRRTGAGILRFAFRRLRQATTARIAKYRIVFVDGQPYACHMAIVDRWDIWYLNAGMSHSADKRLEETDIHAHVRCRLCVVAIGLRSSGIAERIGLDYFTVDCAETRRGSLLVFEADNTAIVHDMDCAELFRLQAAADARIFDAFATMLESRARFNREHAA